MLYWPAIGATLLPNVGGLIGGILSSSQTKTKDGSMAWYDTLKKPTWTPPNWVFGPVWATLHSSMGFASYLAYRDGGGFSGDARIPLIVYGIQLALNWIWSPIFFGAHKLKLSHIVIVAMYASAAACGALFYKINPVAGYLIIPYVAWLSLATPINYFIWRDNPDGGAKIKKLKD